MSGQQFVRLLGELGFPQADTLDGSSFDWMFGKDAVLPFLDWLCDEVHQANLLSPKDLQKFRELEQKQGVLEGEQLQEALHNLSSFQDEELSEERLREEITQLSEELEQCQERKDILVQQRNKLSLRHTALSDRLSKMDSLENAAKLEYKMQLEQSQADNAKTNTSLQQLLEVVSELCSFYEKSVSGTDQQQQQQEELGQSAAFLSQMNLGHYHSMEEKFTHELTAYTKKQFFQGIAEMAGQNEGSRYEFLEVTNPDSLLVKGEREDVVLDDCKELARLQAFYPKSEAQRVNALVEEKSYTSACDFVEQRLDTLKAKPYPQDITELSNRLKEAQTMFTVVRRDMSTAAEQEVPALIKDNAASQLTKVLQGDYDLKIARQDYFTSNQDQVIMELVRQRSRNEFLTMAYEIEAKGHRDTHHLLTAVNMLLQKNHRALQSRLSTMKDISQVPARHQRATVDSRDKLIIRLHKLIDEDGFQEKQQLFLSYSQLGENAERMCHQAATLKASLSTAGSNHSNKLAVLESSLNGFESKVYSGSSTMGGQPVLSPQPITDALAQLDGMMKKLEQAVMDIIKDIEHKKKALRNDPLQGTERKLYTYFFNNPDRLRRALDEVSARLQAQLVK